ncbi:MAG: hypothetical protein QG636_311 [Patescibacteria group bacterium]|nr:hypothetical protein [Patescibacteria group bacterium]
MEGFSQSPKNPESLLIAKHKLLPGTKVAFEKVAMHSPSEVAVGEIIEGSLQDTVKVGERITFSDSVAAISDVKKIEEVNGKLLIHTGTSTYALLAEAVPEGKEDFDLDDVEMVETAMGSTYRYLPDGTTQRFKRAEGKEYEPQAALVYVPNWEWIQQNMPPGALEKLGGSEAGYESKLLTFVQNPFKDGKKVYIVDETGKQTETNQELREIKGPIYLGASSNGVTEFFIPVSHKPKIGFGTFDTRYYVDEKTGKDMRERHLGNSVTKIVLKGGVQIGGTNPSS